MSVNKCIFLGRLGKDPELRETPTGEAVCNFSLALNNRWKDKSGVQQEHTEWVNVEVWGKLGELCKEYLTQGKQAYVEARVKTRTWDDDNGVKQYKTNYVANTVQWFGGKDDTN